MRALTSAVALVLTFGQPAAAQELASSIVGTWKLTSHTQREVASGATINAYGQNPVGHFIYTRGGHVLWFFVADNRKAPASANITDAERVDLFKSMAAGGGTYRVDGKKITVRYDTSWHQLWTGKDQSADAEITGNTLALTTTPFKRSSDGKEVVVVSTWERAE
jgi:hypothetical protein